MTVGPTLWAQVPTGEPPGNRVVEFDGKGSYVELPEGLGDDWEAATIEFRARWDGLSYFPALVQFGNTSTAICFTQDESFPAPRVYSQLAEGQPSVIGLEDRVDLGQWIHLAATFETSRMRFWVNGVCMGTNRLAAPGLTGLHGAPSRWLGRSAWTMNGFFRGRMDEFRLWNRILGDTELAQLPHRRVEGTEPGLQARWSMDRWVAAPVRPSHPGSESGRPDGTPSASDTETQGQSETAGGICWSDGALRLPAILRGHARAVTDGSLDRATFDAPWWLEGTVQGPDGVPVAADLRWLEDDIQWWRVVSGIEGRFRWRGARSGVSGRLRATAGTAGILSQVDLRIGHPIRVDLKLESIPAVEGRVIRWDGTTRAGVRLRIRLTDPNASQPTEGWITRSDAEGRFAFPALPDGDYVVECESRADAFSETPDSRVPPQRLRVRRSEGSVPVTFRVAAGIDGTVWQRFTRRDGLPDNALTALALDRRGSLWIGTSAGLARYDGGRFTAWTREIGLADGQVAALAVDAKDDLWVAGRDGLVRMRGNLFERQSVASADAGLAISDMTCSRDGALWLATDRGVHRYHGGTWRAFDIQDGLPGRSVQWIWPDENDSVRALLRANLNVKLTTRGIESYPSYQPFSWAIDPLNSSGPRSEDRAADLDQAKWKRKGYPLVRGDGVQVDPESLDIPWAFQVRSILKANDRETWVATHQHGLLRIATEASRSLTTAHGLPSAGVQVSLRAKDGALWIGTSAGLVRWNGAGTQLYQEAQGIAGNPVFDLLQAPDETIWAAGSRGIARWKDGRFQSVPGVPLNKVNALRSGPDNKVWAFIQGLGLLVGDETGMTGVHGNALQPYVWSSDFLFTSSRQLVVASPKGVMRIDGMNAVPLYTTLGGFGNETQALLESHTGALWVGTAGSGLYRRGVDGTWDHFDLEDGLASRMVRCLHEDSRGWIWVGTSDGLNLYRDGLWGHLDDLDGLAGLDVCHIRSEGDGSIWISTDGGLTRYVPSLTAPRAAWSPIRHTGASDTSAFEEDVVAGQRIAFAVDTASGHKVRWRMVQGNHAGEWTPLQRGHEWEWVPTQLGPVTLEAQVVDRDLNRSSTLRRTLRVEVEWYRSSVFMGCAAATGLGVVAMMVYLAATLHRQRRESARLKQEADLLAAADRARMEFERRLIRSQEAERGRISRELHDSLGQELLLIRNSALLARRDAGDNSSTPVLGEIADRASRTIEEVRAIAYALRPQELDRYGLAAAMRALCDDLAATDAPEIVFQAESPIPALAPEMEIGLFRILQECLTNVLKHADASRVECHLTSREGGAALRVSDNGRGFDPDSVGGRDSAGLGLSGMRERVRLLGGRFHIQSHPDQGTRVEVWIPAAPAPNGPQPTNS